MQALAWEVVRWRHEVRDPIAAKRPMMATTDHDFYKGKTHFLVVLIFILLNCFCLPE